MIVWPCLHLCTEGIAGRNAVQPHHTVKGLTMLHFLLLEFRVDGWDRIRNRLCIGLAPWKCICRTYWSLCLCLCQKTQSAESSLAVSSPTPRLMRSFFVPWWHWDIYFVISFSWAEWNCSIISWSVKGWEEPGDYMNHQWNLGEERFLQSYERNMERFEFSLPCTLSSLENWIKIQVTSLI